MLASLRDAIVFSDIIGWRAVEAAMLGLVIVAAAIAVAAVEVYHRLRPVRGAR